MQANLQMSDINAPQKSKMASNSTWQWWWVGEKLFVKTDCHRLAPLSTRLSATNRQQHWHSWNHNDDDDDDGDITIMMVMVVTTTLTKLMMIHDNAKEEEMKSAKPQKESRRWDAPALCEKRLQAPKIGADGGGLGNWYDDNDK